MGIYEISEIYESYDFRLSFLSVNQYIRSTDIIMNDLFRWSEQNRFYLNKLLSDTLDILPNSLI